MATGAAIARQVGEAGHWAIAAAASMKVSRIVVDLVGLNQAAHGQKAVALNWASCASIKCALVMLVSPYGSKASADQAA